MASDEGGKASKDVSQLVHTSAAFVNDAELAAAAGDKRGCVDLTPEAACSKVARPRVHDSPDYRQLDELVMALRGQLEQAKCTISANNRELNSLRAERDLLKLELQALRTAPVASMANSAARSQERQSAMQANNGGGAAAPGGGSSNCKNKQTGTHSSVIVLDSDGETEQPAEEVNDDDASMHTSGDASSLDNPRARSQVDAEGEGEEKEMSESGAKTTEDEELVFISSSGELGGDLPHPRNLCPRWKFFPVGDSIEKVPADKEEANRKCCKNCYCFLCDVNSSECRRWSTGNRSWLSHCNAHAGVKVCKELRSVFRHGLAVSPRIEDVLRPNCMKLGVEELLKVHRSFESFKRGHENMAWDDRRKKTYVVKEHTLHLGSALQGLSSALGVQLDAQLIVKHGDAQQPFETGVRLIEVTQHIYQIDLLLGTVLSFTFAREGFSAQEVSVQNAWDQYLRCVRSLNFLLSVALLVVAMHGSVPAGASGQEVSTKVQWSDVKEAMQERLTQFIQHIRDSRETFCGEYYCKLLEDTFAVPLAACTRGWSPDSGLDVGETGRTELRQAGLKALLAAGSQADLEAFVNKTENRDLMSLCFITGMVSRGLFDAACDAVLALAPENASSRSRSWLTTAQFYDLWNRFWCANVAAGIRFGLRAALGDALPHRPDNDRFDPGFSARCTILKKVISELCKRREGENEAAAWQQAWTRVTTTDQLQSIAAIRTTACQVLDEAGCKWPRPAAYDGTQLRKGLLSHCADGAVASPHGRLLFVEVMLSCCHHHLVIAPLIIYIIAMHL